MPSSAMFDFCTFTKTYSKSRVQFFIEITVYHFIAFFNWFVNYIDWTKRLSQHFIKLSTSDIESVKFFNNTARYIQTYIYYSTILKTAKLFGFLHHQALLIYK